MNLTQTGLSVVGILLLAIGANAQETSKKPDKLKDATEKKSTEKVAQDIRLKALWDGRNLAPFKAIDFPPMVKASEADFMDDTEYVLGITVNGESRAYPTRFAWWHHIINDKIGKKESGGEAFVTVTY